MDTTGGETDLREEKTQTKNKSLAKSIHRSRFVFVHRINNLYTVSSWEVMQINTEYALDLVLGTVSD